MNIHRWMPVFLGCLLPLLCMANTPHIDPQAESLYQQAVPYLQQADAKLEAVPANFPSASAEEKKRSHALLDEAAGSLKPAIALLEQAATLDHPVAQHRLAMIYVLFYPIEEIREKACPLFLSSFRQGFAPPALQLSSFCFEFTGTPEFQTRLKAIATSAPAYEQYFPQPAVKLECRAEMPQGLAFQWGSGRDFQAEMYRLLGDSNRAQRAEYYQKAIAINDCYKAKKRLERSQ